MPVHAKQKGEEIEYFSYDDRGITGREEDV
jgi:hypothetical protein